MSLLYKETYKPLDVYEIVKCTCYNVHLDETVHHEVKQMFDRILTNRLTGKSRAVERLWKFACKYEWIGGGRGVPPRRISKRLQFFTPTAAERYVEHHREGLRRGDVHMETIKTVGETT